MTLEQLRLGSLHCCVVREADRADRADRALVLCHGFGAPEDDLVPLAGEFVRAQPQLADRTLFLFPAAPLEPPEFRAFGGRAWWPLDMAQLQAAMLSGEFRDLRADSPPRLPTAREELHSLLDAAAHEFGIPLARMVLGGFSQGSMLATDLTLRLPESPAGLVIYSGTLLNEAEWNQLAPRRRGLRVLQSHGRQDPLLPYAAAEWLRDLLTASGLEVAFLPFTGGHTISPAAVRETASRLAAM